MKTLLNQLRFDSKRLIVRSLSFFFFSILMPAGFYVLFTKVMMVAGSSAQQQQFAKTYMGSMIVYSILISAIFGIASILKRDRDQGLLVFLSLAPKGTLPYYVSVFICILGINLGAVVVLGVLAVLLNHVSLSANQWFNIIGLVILCQIPLLLIGTAMSFIKRQETLSVVSNLVTFPMAVVSGLWWPINMLPNWLQTIGKLTPTYFANNTLSQVLTNGKVDLMNVGGVLAWLGLGVALVILMAKRTARKGVVLDHG